MQVISNGTAISVPCRYEEDGDTELVVGPAAEVPRLDREVFDGVIPTPSGEVLFSDPELAILMTYPANSSKTRIRIWTDGTMLPDKVVVGID